MQQLHKVKKKKKNSTVSPFISLEWMMEWGVRLVLTFFKRCSCLTLPVLLVVLESFAGIKPAVRNTGELWLHLLQITLLPAHLGAKLSHLLHTQPGKRGWITSSYVWDNAVQGLKTAAWHTALLSCFTCFSEMFSSFSFMTCLIFCFWFWWPSRRA